MTPQEEAEKIVQDAIDYMLGSGNPSYVVDADWFRLKWTEAVRELIEIQTVFDESNEIISANLDLRKRLAAAKEYVEFIDEHWGNVLALHYPQSPTSKARQKYMEAMK